MSLLVLVVLSGLGLPSGPAARATPGDTLASFDAAVTSGLPQCSSGVGTGIAFDGDDLLLSCWSSNVLQRIDAEDHANEGPLTISGVSDIGAMAYDGTRGKLWACSSGSTVVLIDLETAAVDPSSPDFSTPGCIDGLAYDAEDDTIWTSGDVHSTVYHWEADGTAIDDFDATGRIGSCGNSGIAVGGNRLYLANNGCSQIYQVEKDFSGSSLFATFPRRLEDLECDNITFAPKYAIWSQDAYDRILNAYEIPEASCVFGGGGDALAEGYAYRVRAEALGLDTAKVKLVSQTRGYAEDMVAEPVDVPGTATITVGGTTADAVSDAENETVTAHGSAKLLGVNLLGGAIQADAVFAEARADENAAGAHTTSSDGSGFVGLVVAGTPISDSVPANSTITIPGVGRVVLREEVVDGADGYAAIEVNMIHFTSDDDALELVVSSAFAAAGNGFPRPASAEPREPETPELPSPPQPVMVRQGFEAGTGGWTTTNPDLWQFGPPTSGPDGAYGGENVAGTVLDGDYPAGVTGSLRSPVIDLRALDNATLTATERVAVLRFASWFQSGAYYDCGFVQVSSDAGTTWTHVTPREGYLYPYAGYCGGLYPPGSFSGSDGEEWKEYSIDLTQYAGSQVLVEFVFASFYSANPGWYLDDVGVVIEEP